ncbi:hypothetical protein BACCIP111883_02709 [Sutcliffiella rhizosphaerae]|uniref:Uncharacterized protein n=2 Tax=Sutcliffiella rhizosphaerae TaxID=2880967 RepID=A0ABM8YPL3_9BACI|nr:hypothetical protein BACCIP111883_02709 [Sutcliffiella rhizosphaerae]
MNKIYIISGPAGVGKSTTSKDFAEQFDHSAYIEGDLIWFSNRNIRRRVKA